VRRRASNVIVFSIAIVLSLVGIALIYSASHRVFGFELAFKQASWFLTGLSLALVINWTVASGFYRYRWLLYFFGVALLVLTLFFGVDARGGQRWLSLWRFNLQTSEVMKLFLLLTLAGISEKIEAQQLSRFRGIFYILAVAAVPVVLIFLQPNLGTVLVFLAIVCGWFFISGWWQEGIALVVLGTGGAIGGSLVLAPFEGNTERIVQAVVELPAQIGLVFWFTLGVLLLVTVVIPYFKRRNVNFAGYICLLLTGIIIGTMLIPSLAPYQRERLESFFNPFAVSREGGYSLIQSQIAIGSGGWFGQGYMSGTQSQLGFIPELWTDFIFSVGVEEFGALFAIFIVLCYLLVIYGVFSAAALADEWWIFYFFSGIGIVWIAHLIIGIGMAIGLTPISGLPLPFVSYGGSFLIVNWVMVGLFVKLNRRRSFL